MHEAWDGGLRGGRRGREAGDVLRTHCCTWQVDSQLLPAAVYLTFSILSAHSELVVDFLFTWAVGNVVGRMDCWSGSRCPTTSGRQTRPGSRRPCCCSPLWRKGSWPSQVGTLTATARWETRPCAAAACWRLRWRRQDSRGDLCCCGGGWPRQAGRGPHLVTLSQTFCPHHTSTGARQKNKTGYSHGPNAPRNLYSQAGNICPAGPL